MYQFVVAVLVPLQTLLARMCGVAGENLVLEAKIYSRTDIFSDRRPQRS